MSKQLQKLDSLQVLTYDSTRVNWAILNVPKLKTVEARQGLCYAFPYQENIDSINKGLMKRSGPIPSTMRGYDPDAFEFPTDLDKAKELLAAGGFEEGYTFEYLVSSNYTDDKTTAQLYQSNMQKIGYDLNITEVDSATYDDMIYGDMAADERPEIMGGWAWWPDYNDPWNQLAPNYLISAQNGGGSNAGEWSNDRFEELMTQAEAFTVEDGARRPHEGNPADSHRGRSGRDFLRRDEVLHHPEKRRWRLRPEPALSGHLHVLRHVPRGRRIGGGSWSDLAKGLNCDRTTHHSPHAFSRSGAVRSVDHHLHPLASRSGRPCAHDRWSARQQGFSRKNP